MGELITMLLSVDAHIGVCTVLCGPVGVMWTLVAHRGIQGLYGHLSPVWGAIYGQGGVLGDVDGPGEKRRVG